MPVLPNGLIAPNPLSHPVAAAAQSHLHGPLGHSSPKVHLTPVPVAQAQVPHLTIGQQYVPNPSHFDNPENAVQLTVAPLRPPRT